jgi:hypothetical protein
LHSLSLIAQREPGQEPVVCADQTRCRCGASEHRARCRMRALLRDQRTPPSLLQDQPSPAPSQKGQHYELRPAPSRRRRPVDRVSCPFRVMDLYKDVRCPFRGPGLIDQCTSVLTCGVTKDDIAKYGCCRPALPLCVPSTVAKHGAKTGKIWSSLSPEAPFESPPAEWPVGSRPLGTPPPGARCCRAETCEPNRGKPSGHS